MRAHAFVEDQQIVYRPHADDAVSSEFHQLLMERGDTGGAAPRGPTHLMPPTTVRGMARAHVHTAPCAGIADARLRMASFAASSAWWMFDLEQLWQGPSLPLVQSHKMGRMTVRLGRVLTAMRQQPSGSELTSS